jgi:Flp pilus assembly protein TadB
MPESVLISVVPLLLLGAGAVAAAMLFFSLRRENGELRRRMATLESTANCALVELQRRLDDLSERLRQAEERPESSPAAARSGVNLNNRAQALRMLRRGIDAETVATSLNLPRPEIELLIRVQQLSASSGGATSEIPGG